MLSNRSMPRGTVIPELAYPDVREAVAWLCDAFGFTLRLPIANHRAQLNVGDGAIVVTESHLALWMRRILATTPTAVMRGQRAADDQAATPL